MEELIKKRGRLKAKLTRIGNFVDQSEFGAFTKMDVKIRLDLLTETWSEFEIIQTKIECTCPDAELATQEQEQEDFEIRFCAIKAKLLQLQEESNIESDSQVRPSKTSTQVRLPAIELPTFSGDFKEWKSFEDLFQSVVHMNTTITQVQKLHYLKVAVKGDAARLLSSIAITEANYLEAWKILRDRYSNKKQVIQSHLKALYEQPKLVTERARDIRRLLDVTVENLRALHALGLPIEEWDCLMIFLVTERLDSNTRRHWELSMGDQDDPSFEDFKDYLEKRCRALEAAGPEKETKVIPMKVPSRTGARTATSYVVIPASCVKCKAQHSLYRCEGFLQLSIEERIKFVRSSSLCYNCLRVGHTARECKSSSCKKCQLRHNTVLHRELKDPLNVDRDTTAMVSNHSQGESSHTQILLATALVNIPDSNGVYHLVRTLLDSGSQASFVSEACVQKLRLKQQRANVTVGGLGTTNVGTCKSAVQLHVHSMHTSYDCHVLALVLPRVTGTIPLQPVDQSSLLNTIRDNHLDLADPHYHHPGQVDLLLGAEVYYELLLSGRVKEAESSTVFQNTKLGWVISGSVPTTYGHITVNAHLGLQELDHQLRTFWELEENSVKWQLTAEELRCEEHFKDTYTRDVNGRFVVKLPFRDNLEILGDTSSIATHRLIQMEKRLDHNTSYKGDYHAFMNEYLSLHHMEEVGNSPGSAGHYYLPHHFVIKESSSTTRMRVVFDGTVRPNTGLSLNETLMVGPVVQEELLDILMRFRMHNIVFIADIEKMYRQILIHSDHRNYQRIKWRTSSDQAVKDYRLTTVTYGTACAPFLATRCLRELAITGEFSHPLASAVIKQDFYVDDLMSGANTVQDALQIQSQLNDLLSSGGMQLRKWASNNTHLMEGLPEHLHNREGTLDITQGTIKALGIQWQPNLDKFLFKVTVDSPSITTKRTVLSQISRLFDPLGWLSPVIVRAKMMIQQLWLLGIGWDEHLPSTLALEWKQFHSELKFLEQLSIPRQMVGDSATPELQLHGFCDASEAAFGAVIFVRSIHNHQPTVRLVCSKSRVAPLKKISLPRLELCGAVVLARLMSRVRTTLNVDSQIHMWTDSTVVLAWLRKPPFYWKTFIANRVTEIQDLVSPDHWRHVSSEDNPADCLSRGQSPQQLLNNTLWWSGPEWLIHDSNWPLVAPLNDHSIAEIEHRRPSLQCHVASTQVLLSITDHSSLVKLIRVTSYCKRFVSNCRPGHTRTFGFLTTQELQESLWHWIAVAQNEMFSQEMHDLHTNQSVSNKSALRSLYPFIDSHGLLRVGGRLQQSLLSYDQKHPLILPTSHALTTLIVRYEHIRNLHAGPHLLQADLGRKYWIPGGKKLIRHVIHQCVRCFRLKIANSQQLMGELPQERVTPSRVFWHCGIDYAGPLLLKLAKGRGNGRTRKAYICIFICFATKAIHIELISDLSTPSFIAGLRRFVARRGKPMHIYSDCGTNFIGADHYLRDVHHLISSSDHNQRVSNSLSQDGINWHFNPPSAPHFGGLWEAGVKSIKYHLHRIVGNVSLTFEEMYTVLTQVESCLNSRPLCPMTTDPDDLGVLTPGHFLIGEALTAAPDRNVTDVPLNRLSRWELIQRLYQHFWKRWASEYLSRLQQRPKWTIIKPNIAVGDLVLIKETQLSPLHWPMARVTCVHPGSDGLVRVVTLKTANGLLKRPLSKCCMLPIEGSNVLSTV